MKKRINKPITYVNIKDGVVVIQTQGKCDFRLEWGRKWSLIRYHLMGRNNRNGGNVDTLLYSDLQDKVMQNWFSRLASENTLKINIWNKKRYFCFISNKKVLNETIREHETGWNTNETCRMSILSRLGNNPNTVSLNNCFTRNNHIVSIKTIQLFRKWDKRCFAYCFVLRRLIFNIII